MRKRYAKLDSVLNQCLHWDTLIVLGDFNAVTGTERAGYELCGSSISRLFEINAIKTLLYRCYALSSDWFSFEHEVNSIRTLFHHNGFSLNIINNTIYKFLESKFSQLPSNESQTTRKKYIKLPLYGHLSYTIRKTLITILKTHYPNTKFIFIFTNTFTIVSLNSKIAFLLDLSLISFMNLRVQVARLDTMGKPKGIKHRISEHRGVSVRTRKQLGNPSFSAVRTHSHSHDHPFTRKDFNILHKAYAHTAIRTLKAIYIKHMKPELNN